MAIKKTELKLHAVDCSIFAKENVSLGICGVANIHSLCQSWLQRLVMGPEMGFLNACFFQKSF